MSRVIVLCFDGTNNEYRARNTNVVKIYSMLDHARTDLLCYYQPGIGTFAPPGVWGKVKTWIVTRLDLAIAWLLQDHVTDGYRFLMRYYQEGDRIFIFGFSRGAYTARALAAMLYKVGLLTQGNEELIPFAWNTFKRERDVELYKGFRHTFGRKVPIHFLGLWDTVSSIGWAWNPKYLQFTANNPIVEVVRHAVSLDERRTNFVQNLWGHDIKSTDVLQVWFPGVHSDVGGGYKENEAGLSKIALKWMVEQGKQAGLQFHPKGEAAILPAQDTARESSPNPAAERHESLKGLWWIVEFLPKRIRDPANNWAARWIIPLGRHRFVAENANIHQSVFERRKLVPSYNPPNLPTNYVVIPG
jgi:uncharacterized protein (DUF2235 family)